MLLRHQQSLILRVEAIFGMTYFLIYFRISMSAATYHYTDMNLIVTYL